MRLSVATCLTFFAISMPGVSPASSECPNPPDYYDGQCWDNLICDPSDCCTVELPRSVCVENVEAHRHCYRVLGRLTDRVRIADPSVIAVSLSPDGPFVAEVEAPIIGTCTVPIYFKALRRGSTFEFGENNGFCYRWREWRVTGFSSLALEPIANGLTDNPNPGGGLRIFPDKQSPDDSASRNTLRVTATIDPPDPDILVTFKSFDVDDPSSDSKPLDPNGSAGNDNNGGCGTFKSSASCTASVRTDSTGVASDEFRVTMSPGDNFRVAAACSRAYMDGVTVDGTRLKDTSGRLLPTAIADVTDMLTVWRRLHIELDSMGTVTQNRVEGLVTGAGETSLHTDQTLEANRFENGRIRVLLQDAGGPLELGSFAVAGNDRSKVDLTAQVPATIRSLCTRSRGKGSCPGLSFLLFDDDDLYNDDASQLHGDEGEDVASPEIARTLEASDDPSLNVFAPAYVLPTYDLTGTSESVPFRLNSPTDDPPSLVSTYEFDNAAYEADPAFWTVYLLGAYQPSRREDKDPAKERAVVGHVDALNGQGASVFMETSRVEEVGSGGDVFEGRSNTALFAAHEIGHLFNGAHGDGELMGPKRGGLAGPHFSDTTLARIRRILHP